MCEAMLPAPPAVSTSSAGSASLTFASDGVKAVIFVGASSTGSVVLEAFDMASGPGFALDSADLDRNRAFLEPAIGNEGCLGAGDISGAAAACGLGGVVVACCDAAWAGWTGWTVCVGVDTGATAGAGAVVAAAGAGAAAVVAAADAGVGPRDVSDIKDFNTALMTGSLIELYKAAFDPGNVVPRAEGSLIPPRGIMAPPLGRVVPARDSRLSAAVRLYILLVFFTPLLICILYIQPHYIFSSRD